MTTIKTIYEHKCAIIRLSGELDDSSLIEICDQIDLAIGYYQLRKIDIHILSISCSIKSIDYYLSKLNSWSSRAVIGTLATSVISDFGIDIISSGTVGYRRAFRSAVFQNTGIRCSSIGFKQTVSRLEDSTGTILNIPETNRATQHYDSSEPYGQQISYSQLDRFRGKQVISSNEAISLKLIDYCQDDLRFSNSLSKYPILN